MECGVRKKNRAFEPIFKGLAVFFFRVTQRWPKIDRLFKFAQHSFIAGRYTTQ
jgi:hypothetical protein